MTAASRAIVVLGFPRAGPTFFAITPTFATQRFVGGLSFKDLPLF